MANQFRHRTSSIKKTKNNWKDKIWSSNIFSFILIILLIVSFIKTGKEVMLRYEIKKEINILQSQLGNLESKTAKMDKLITYLKTDEYIERQARLELNLSKPGEKQINLSDLARDNKDLVANQEPNMKKWFNYFFN